MRIVILAAVIAALALPAAASDETDADAVLQNYNKAFSPTYCAAGTTIIDDFGPYFWSGPQACADWLKSFEAFSKAEGITGAAVTPGKPLHVTVDGNRAYAVYSAKFDYNLKGKPVHERGTWTVTFRKQGGAWRIAAWAWGQL